MKKKDDFGGATKIGESFFGRFEKNFVSKNLKFIPAFIETYHLTLMTLLWSLGVLLFGWFSRTNIYFLIGICFMIIFQYITDLFDGAIGRHRKTGLVRWGYYMDHFLDYVFLYSLLVAYSFILGELNYIVVFIGVVFGAFMVSSFLSFNASNEFRISYFGIGPTEIRIFFIILNLLVILLGVQFLRISLPYILIISLSFLVILIYRTQNNLWNLDMKIVKILVIG